MRAGARKPSRIRLVADLDLSKLSDQDIAGAKRTMHKLMEHAFNGVKIDSIKLGAITAFWFVLGSEERRRSQRAATAHRQV